MGELLFLLMKRNQLGVYVIEGILDRRHEYLVRQGDEYPIKSGAPDMLHSCSDSLIIKCDKRLTNCTHQESSAYSTCWHNVEEMLIEKRWASGPNINSKCSRPREQEVPIRKMILLGDKLSVIPGCLLSDSLFELGNLHNRQPRVA